MIRFTLVFLFILPIFGNPCKHTFIGERCNSSLGSGFCVADGLCLPQGSSNFTEIPFNCSINGQVCCVVPDGQLPSINQSCTPFAQGNGTCMSIFGKSKHRCNESLFVGVCEESPFVQCCAPQISFHCKPDVCRINPCFYGCPDSNNTEICPTSPSISPIPTSSDLPLPTSSILPIPTPSEAPSPLSCNLLFPNETICNKLCNNATSCIIPCLIFCNRELDKCWTSCAENFCGVNSTSCDNCADPTDCNNCSNNCALARPGCLSDCLTVPQGICYGACCVCLTFPSPIGLAPT